MSPDELRELYQRWRTATDHDEIVLLHIDTIGYDPTESPDYRDDNDVSASIETWIKDRSVEEDIDWGYVTAM